MDMNFNINLNISRRHIVASALIIIAMVGMYGWFVNPHTKYLMAAEKYGRAVSEIEKSTKLMQLQVDTREKRLSELSRQFLSASESFFDVDSAQAFLSGIQLLVSQSGCVVENLSFSPAERIDVSEGSRLNINEYRIVLSVIGQYADTVVLLNSLQKRSQKVWLNNIELQLKDMTTGLLSCDVEMSIYTLKVMESAKNVYLKE